MQKKYVSSRNPKQIFNEIKGFSQPVFHQKSECYVSFSCFDPASGQMRLKKIMLGHIKGKRSQRIYADLFIGNLTRKLMSGWNPFVTAESSSQYSLWHDVVKSYRIYLQKVASDDGYREETIISYTSRLRILENWIETHHINLYYAYQFNEDLVTKFLEYVWIDRNNSIRTRNN